MAKRKILHIAGAEASGWLIGQLAAQYRLLPDELFEQTIAAGEDRVARMIEDQVLHPAVRLHRRMRIEYSAARNLARFLRQHNPDLVVCWDIQATEQLKLAMRGSRRPAPAVAMLFSPSTNEELLFKLKSNFHHVGLHLVCGSERLAQWARQELSIHQRLHCVYPAFEKSAENLSKDAIRLRLGLKPEDVVVFVPTEGKNEDIHQAFIGCGILERINHKVRIVIAEHDPERLWNFQRFIEQTIVPRILHVVDPSNIRLAVAAADAVVQPMTCVTETLVLLEALGRCVPVVTNSWAEPAELLRPGETFWNLDKTNGRAIAGGLNHVLTDSDLRSRLTADARESVQQKCSEGEYRARIVKLYQQLLTPQLEA